MVSNKTALDNGFKKAKKIIFDHLHKQLIKLCDALVIDAVQKREFQSFTGNTITSFACGIYTDGTLDYMVASGEKMKAPVHAKVENGQTVFLKNPYEGVSRSTTGKVDIVYKMSGMDTSFNILKGFRPSGKGLAVIMTTGTEYSTYLESMYHLNVLSNTATDANVKRLVYSSFKPLP